MTERDGLQLGPGELDIDHVRVRTLTADDLEAVVRIDEMWSGISRREFFRAKIERSLGESSIHLSLAAELDDMLVGFVTVVFYQGEFGRPEPIAVLDAIGVHRAYAGKKVAKALMHQLEMNLRALRVERIRTEVAWDHFELLSFVSKAGFQPAPRLCLEKVL